MEKDASDSDDDVMLISSYSNVKGKRKCFEGESSNLKSVSSIRFNIIIPLKSVCEICTNEKLHTDMFHILGCAHYYCCSCIVKYVSSKLQENVTTINCPVASCAGILEPYHCRAILPNQVFDRWGDALCEAAILDLEKLYCPLKDCSAMLIDDKICGDKILVQSKCPYCNQLFCAQCMVPWHLGIDCIEFQKLKVDERSNEDIMLRNLAKSNKWQRCPKCLFYVERSEGCLHMTCRCKHSFCYHCAAPVDSHNCFSCRGL